MLIFLKDPILLMGKEIESMKKFKKTCDIIYLKLNSYKLIFTRFQSFN